MIFLPNFYLSLHDLMSSAFKWCSWFVCVPLLSLCSPGVEIRLGCLQPITQNLALLRYIHYNLLDYFLYLKTCVPKFSLATHFILYNNSKVDIKTIQKKCLRANVSSFNGGVQMWRLNGRIPCQKISSIYRAVYSGAGFWYELQCNPYPKHLYSYLKWNEFRMPLRFVDFVGYYRFIKQSELIDNC